MPITLWHCRIWCHSILRNRDRCCLPSKHSVCIPFCLFFSILSKKLSGFHVSVQNTIETVSPKLYNCKTKKMQQLTCTIGKKCISRAHKKNAMKIMNNWQHWQVLSLVKKAVSFSGRDARCSPVRCLGLLFQKCTTKHCIKNNASNRAAFCFSISLD